MNNCLGCGSKLQSIDSSKEGYIRENNISSKLCERCFRIRNYGEYKTVVKDNNDFEPILKKIGTTNSLVILVIDLFMMNKDFDVLTKNLNNDILLVFTKRDVLPKIVNDQKFIEYAKGQSYENQFRFILQTGLRTGELVGLKWEDIDFSKKAIRIQRSMEYRYSVGEWRIGEPKSKAGYRTIPLTDETIRILTEQKEKNKNIKKIQEEWYEFIFLSRKGEPVKNSAYDTALFKICDKAKINRFSMHVLRHTFATRCIEGGMMPKTLQKILGHSNIGITMNLYVHITEDEKQKEIDKVSCVLNVG